MKALVLQGGGSHGAYEVGVLRHWLQNQKTCYDLVAGISVGSINAAFLAQYGNKPDDALLSYQGLVRQWDLIKGNSSIYKNWFLPYVSALWKPSVYDSKPLQTWLKTGLKGPFIRELRIVSTSWNSGEVFVANQHTPDLADWVIGSSAFPLMLTPVSINNQLWADGGLRSQTPLGEAIKAGATEVDVILCSNPYGPDVYNPKGADVIGLALRAVSIMIDQIARADLQICGLKNDLVVLNSKYRKVEIRKILSPSQPTPQSPLDFSPSTIKTLMNLGYTDALKAG